MSSVLNARATAAAGPQPGRCPSASACAPYRDTIELGRFVRQFHASPSPEACEVIETAPGEAAQVDHGAGRPARRFLYVTGTGSGVGIMIDGRPYCESGGWRREAGHHTIDPTGPTCYCGVRGCWESLASGPAMTARVRAHTRAEEAA